MVFNNQKTIDDFPTFDSFWEFFLLNGVVQYTKEHARVLYYALKRDSNDYVIKFNGKDITEQFLCFNNVDQARGLMGKSLEQIVLNNRIISTMPFIIHLDKDPYPKRKQHNFIDPWFCYGSWHCHSNYHSNDYYIGRY